MKSLNFKKVAATVLSLTAMLAAVSASSLCVLFIFGEPKMPKSLIKQD